ncbi:DUF6383 domain-containing protein [Parabacteroides johnsonii]|uniref:DUF6383 domain-containing protein n=1 Tax=Parabacteroides johnsonii TaxID=387661 RepID=UPI00242E9406|nr:DUF6383 domain-containing protein [Parabacteroides johnsonii]MBS6225897.1 hypothetical protein [Parabacteroides johnsonii]
MNKKFTLLAAALMTASAFTANAEDSVKAEEWTVGNYYYLKSGNSYLALDGDKPDSVIVKPLDEAKALKASIDSALWQIADKETALGVTTYKITNKATQDVLSFAAKADADMNLASGVDKWVISEDGKIIGFYDGENSYSLKVEGDDLSLDDSGTVFTVEAPKKDFALDAKQLGNGFSVFQLMFGDTYEGNIFEGKELLATDLKDDEGYVSLQFQGDLTWSDGKPKYLGVDTTKTEIAGAIGAYGAKFVADSTYESSTAHSVGNADFQKFKFTVNLKNDSIAMFVKAAPNVNAEKLAKITDEDIRVVYAQTGSTKVLTVSETGDALQGALPKITAKRGTPATIPTGEGVYFLQKVSKGADNGKYFAAGREFMGKDSVPTAHQVRGQWLVKEKNGKYAIADREADTELTKGFAEIFEVQGMEDTYLIGGDSVKIKKMNVDLKNQYLGSFAATEEELVNKGFYLSLFSATAGVPELFMFADDTIMKGSAEELQLFKFFPKEAEVKAGAKSLGDTIKMIPYQLGIYFRNGKVAKAKDGEEGLRLSASAPESVLSFYFLSDANGQFYSMKTGDKYVGIDVNTSKLQLTDTKTVVNIAPEDAPEYASFEAGHKRISVDGNSLVMNPLNRFAQMKAEGSEITKAVYEKDNFSLWVEPDTVVAGKQLYFISSVVDGTRYYLSFKDTTVNGISAEAYKNAMFLPDTVKTVKDSPALFAFKVNEHGGYILENQQQLKGGYPYVGIVGNSVVLERFASVAFEVQTTSAPTANEEMNVSEIKVISNDGQVIVTNASGKMITLSNILGQTIGVRRANSEYFSMPATSGIVLVTVEGDTTYKVIVK